MSLAISQEELEELKELFLEGVAPILEVDRYDLESLAYWILERAMMSERERKLFAISLRDYNAEELKEWIANYRLSLPSPVLCGTYKTKHLTKFINEIK